MLDIIILNGKYPEFSGGEFLQKNIGIKDGKIAYVGNNAEEAKTVINGKDRVVSPGFVDIHMHEENFAADGDKYIIAELMLRMGVTTACGGNCGIQHQRLETFKEKIAALGGSPINYVMLAGYNQMRYYLGLHHEEMLSVKDSQKIRTLLMKELAEGAAGISFGIEYDPAISYEEMLEALTLLKGKDYIASAHFRKSGSSAIDSIKEMNRLCQASGVKFQVSHLCSCSAIGQMSQSLELLNQLIKANPLLNYDTYPYNAFSTIIGSAVFEKESLKQWCEDIGAIMLTQEPYKNQFCTEKLLEEARATYPDMMAVGFIMNEDEVKDAITNVYGMIASDAILNKGNGHPRAAGTFPRVLGKYVREEKALSLMDALRKITLLPAQRLSLQEKGRIEVGADGDLTIFDPETIEDAATYNDLYISPKGIDYVIVNGKLAMDHTKIINGRAGQFLPFINR